MVSRINQDLEMDIFNKLVPFRSSAVLTVELEELLKEAMGFRVGQQVGAAASRAALEVNLFPQSTEITRRESLYLEHNVLFLRMLQDLQNLTVRTGIPITQENGQRRYGPPMNYKGPPIEKGSEIFVGKLPRELYEDEIVPVFEKAGEIFELRLMMDFSGTNRGYCFIQYYSVEAACRAIKMFNDYEIRPGRYLGVVKSVDNCRLFVGGIPRDKTREDIFNEIRKITEGVTRAIVNPSPTDHKKNRGYAFIEYQSHRSAAMARRKMMPGKIFMFGVPVAVDWAEPEPDVDSSIMSKVSNLYVRNVSLETTEEELFTLFSAHSHEGVDKVKKIKDYAFVHFVTRNQAEEAMRGLDGSELNGCTLEICWAKPVSKVAYKAKKAMARHLYASNNGGTYTKDGNHNVGGQQNSTRIFGPYNSLSCVSNNQIVYQQMAHGQQCYNNTMMTADYNSYQYQNGSLLGHDSGQRDRNSALFAHYFQSGQIIHPNVAHSKALAGVPTDYSGRHVSSLYIPMSPGQTGYRSGPMMTSYMTPMGVGLPYVF